MRNCELNIQQDSEKANKSISTRPNKNQSFQLKQIGGLMLEEVFTGDLSLI